MAKYRKDHYALPQPRLTCSMWLEGQAYLWGPDYMAVLERSPQGNLGEVSFCAGGRYHYITFKPCPTRAGLVRMACREIRKIVGENHEA